uniref:Uncharacterized protein n=1 Tax=Rhizophora mucronata TaxID=61149 RepID=A0A2P2JM03_RHIMU
MLLKLWVLAQISQNKHHFFLKLSSVPCSIIKNTAYKLSRNHSIQKLKLLGETQELIIN